MSAESFLGGKAMLCCGDSIHFMRDQPENRYDSIVCDPPYVLVSIVKRFGADNAVAANGDVYKRSSAGFMGKKWDTGDSAHNTEFWREALRVLKPGGYVLAFAGTRTYHRLACAIEDAGFEIRDMISWLYGSGFPKSHNTGNGWGTALKPACEPICMARKPLSEGTVAANVLKWGTGAINVDGCRVESEAWTRPGSNGIGGIYGDFANDFQRSNDKGRWPANVIHDGSEEVVAGFPDSDGAVSNGSKTQAGLSGTDTFKIHAREQLPGYADSGSAARFFYQAAKDDRCDLCDANIVHSHFSTKNIQTGNSVHYDVADSPQPASVAKPRQSKGRVNSAASPSKECHPQNGSIAQSNVLTSDALKIARNVSDAANLCGLCATAIAQEIVAASRKEPLGLSLSNLSTEGFKKTILLRSLASYVAGRENTDIILTTTNLKELFGCVFHAIAENINSARVGSEESTEPAPKRLWYSSKADSDDRLGSKHPTVKPVDLMQYLVRLVTPKGGLVLDPFAGTGTTAEACFREGMTCAMVEREPEYQADIRRRMALVMAGPQERSHESIKAKQLPVDYGPLFSCG
jgi:site-specific DNA-methyltransferase (adenine-specific)